MWQPIETAPKNTTVLVWGEVPGYMHPHTAIACFHTRHTLPVADGYEEEDWVDVGPDGDAYMPEDWYEECLSDDARIVNLKPKFWMPLPPPPEINK